MWYGGVSYRTACFNKEGKAMSYYTKCIDCRAEFTQEECLKANCCPACKSVGIPLVQADDIQIKINWHELRVLTMWAEFWAQHQSSNNPESIGMKQTVKSIATAMEEQYPSRVPLTMAGELGEAKDRYPDMEVVGPIQPESRKKIH